MAYLQFYAVQLRVSEWQIDYELILPSIRNGKNKKVRPKNVNLTWQDAQNNQHVPLGRTIVRPGSDKYPFYYSGYIEIPFRDGMRAQWDRRVLGGLPLLYVCHDKYYLLDGTINLTNN